MKKKVGILLILVIFLGVVLTGCEHELEIQYKNIENQTFENLVKDKVYYSTWFPNIQSTLEFNTEENTVIFTQYYASRYNASLGPNDPPEYPFDYKYVKKSKYLFTEDLKDMAVSTFAHYSTKMNGTVVEEFHDFKTAPVAVKFEKKNEKGTVIKWGYDEYYTKEELEKAGYANYILNPVKGK